MVDRRLAKIPPKYRRPYQLASAGKGSPRNAIKAMCLECVNWVRAEITACPSEACPLWLLRPYQESAGAVEATSSAAQNPRNVSGSTNEA